MRHCFGDTESARGGCYNNNVDDMATDATSVRLLNHKTTASWQREKSLPRGQDTGVTRSHLQPAGQMTAADDGATAFVIMVNTQRRHSGLVCPQCPQMALVK